MCVCVCVCLCVRVANVAAAVTKVTYFDWTPLFRYHSCQQNVHYLRKETCVGYYFNFFLGVVYILVDSYG